LAGEFRLDAESAKGPCKNQSTAPSIFGLKKLVRFYLFPVWAEAVFTDLADTPIKN